MENIKNLKGIDCNGVKLKYLDNLTKFIGYNYPPNQNELNLFLASLKILDNYIGDKCPTFNICNTESINIIFTEFGNINIDTQIECAGSYTKLIRYNVEVWRHLSKCNDSLIMAIYLEELCHCLFQLSDEILVKKKVYEVMNYFNSNFSKEMYENTIGMKVW